MKSIYIGVCKTRDDERFKQSFRNFTDSICRKYSICIEVISNTFLPDAQNRLARSCIEGRYDYLLLLDDDQWGHTPEMLECLIDANTYVATIKTYSRHYPYLCTLFDKTKENVTIPIEYAEGYRECDLTGFPMTLIRRDTFDYLDTPYFRPFKDGDRDWNSDVDFFDRLSKVGIKPVGCFQHCLNHDKITKDNVLEYRRKERFEGNNMGWYRILQNQGV